METKDNDKKLIFLRSKESTDEIFGWKILIFLPQDTSWKLFIVLTVLLKTYGTITGFFYGKEYRLIDDFESFLNIFYLLDVIFATLHFTMKNTRRLKFGKKRPVVYLIIDYISLFPFETIWLKCRYCEDDCVDTIASYLSLLNALRIYQIPLCFSSMRDTAYTMRKFLLINIFEMILYYLISIHVLSCFIYVNFDDNEKKKCLKRFTFCIIENEVVTFCLLGQHYIAPFKGYFTHHFQLLVIFDFLFGYIFTWGYIIPILIFGNFKEFLSRFHVSHETSNSKVLIGFREDDKKLEKKVSEFFQQYDRFGGGVQKMEVQKAFPIAMRKSIYCDLHWEAMKHSMFLHDLSMGCKRSLAVFMKTKFVLPDTVLFEKDKGPTYFLYLESGVLQVLAEESPSSVLNLCGGTVLGEISFFLYKTSPATIISAKYSIIHELSIRDLFKVLMDYPKDKKKILEKVKMRLEFAKSLVSVKINLTNEFGLQGTFTEEVLKKGNIKWIKKQYKAVSSLKEAENQMTINPNNQFYVDDYQRNIQNLETQLKHSSVFIKLLVVCEDTEKVTQVCLKDSVFWVMNPDCFFLLFWEWFITGTIVFIIVVYPAVIGWLPHIPMWFFVTSTVISLILQLDLAMQFVTAVKTNNVTLKKFSDIFLYRVLKPRFFIDLLAAVPLQLFFYDNLKPFSSNCSFAIALIKAYKFVLQLKWIKTERKKFSCRIVINYTVILLVLIYWTAAVFNLTGVECIFYVCTSGDWYNNIIQRAGEVNRLYPPLIRAVILAFEVPVQNALTDSVKSFIVFLCIFTIFHFYNIQMKAGCTAAIILDLSSYMEFKNMMEFLYNFLTDRNLVGNMRSRAISMMQFQWDLEKGITNQEKQKLWELMQQNLKDELNYKLKLPILKKTKLFENEGEQFLMDLCSKAFRLFLPAKSVLLTLGTQTRCLYIVEKGFVQINSFLVGDLYLNTSKRLAAKAGDAFPVIDVLSQTQTAISAVTVTDCKLLLLDLEDVLSLMMIHGMFKDVVLSVRETDLTPLTTVKLAFSDFKDSFTDGYGYRGMIFRRIKCLGRILEFLLKKKAINSFGRNYLIWEFIRVMIQTICFILWPVAMCLLRESKKKWIFIECLLAFEIFPLIDFYIRMNVAYYNRKGIYVTHTLYTLSHYLRTSFIIDLIAFLPNFHVIYMICCENHTITLTYYLFHMLMRSVGLYRFVGLMAHFITKNAHKAFQMHFTMILLLFVVVIHHYVCFLVFLIEKGIMDSKIRLTKKIIAFTEPYEYYLNEVGVMLALVLRNIFYLNEYDAYTLVTNVLGSTIGLLCQIALYSYLVIRSTVKYKNFITYRYYLHSCITFLERQKVEYNIVDEVEDYYEFQWRKLQGRSLKKFFSALPQTLHEDIMLPVYKTTLSGVDSLSNANDYFYRVLSRNLEEVVLKKNTPVIFQEEVQGSIYFLHVGQCTVEDHSITLNKGAVIGDIKRKGIMTNTITTKSDVVLLEISSREFYNILDDFYKVKRSYEEVVKNADDFIVSVFDRVFTTKEHSLSNMVEVVDKEYIECEFLTMKEEQPEQKRGKKEKLKRMTKMNKKTVEILRFIFLVIAYATLIVIPFFITTRLFCLPVMVTIYVMDSLWLIKIILAWIFKFDNVGEKNFSRKAQIFNNIVHLLSVLPIEIVPSLYFGKKILDESDQIFSICYTNRLLRIFYILNYFKMKRNKVLGNITLNLLEILIFKIVLISCCSNIRLQLNREAFINKCQDTLSTPLKEALTLNYLCTINLFVSAAVDSCLPTKVPEVIFQLFVALGALISKAYFINSILVIIYLKQYNRTIQKSEIQYIGKYLTDRDVSPILGARCQTYCSNLLSIFQESGEPHFLKTAPTYLKIIIMQDLCLSNLLKCHLFQQADSNFLKQLAVRVNINVFFPGDHITEKGDVDHNMYFIKKGEVYCLESDETYKALEIPTNVLGPGDTFGLPQGLLLSYPHSNTYRCKTSCSILVLNYYNWEDLRSAFPEITNDIYTRCLDGIKVQR